MWLRRTTPNPFDKSLGALELESHDYKLTMMADEETTVKAVAVTFPRFGEGARRQSDFEVCTEWEDVEKLIEKFCQTGHPQALALRDAAKLAAAVEELEWRRSEPALPQSN
jgi:hypothetical protein